jgi:acyl-CoA synthetase (AMP-forming)/AMP-acid ligase II
MNRPLHPTPDLVGPRGLSLNLAATLHARAAAHPERIAIIETAPSSSRDRLWTYAELATSAAHVATALRARGLHPGDGVLILQPMSGALYAFLVGAWQAGLVCLFVDPSRGRSHLAACTRRWRPRALFGVAAAHWFSLLVPGLRRDLVRIRTRGWAPFANAFAHLPIHRPTAPSTAPDIAHASADTPALVTFTSGSTGEPKAIVRSHGFLHAQHRAIAEALDLQEGQRDLTTLPIFLLANLGAGLTSIIPASDIARPGSIDPIPIADQLARQPATRGGASPAFWLRLAATAEGRTALSGLRTLYTGGGPLWPDDLAALRAAAPGTRIVCVYGSTEAEPIAEIDADEVLAAPESGTLLPGGQIRPEIRCAVLRDRFDTPRADLDADAFAAEQAAPGAIGEIVVSGPHVVAGYLGGVGDRETKFRVDGVIWHRTGDAGLLDSSGRLWLAGRCSARVQVGPRTLYPAEVEVALRGVKGLRRSALLAHDGEACVALEAEEPAVLALASARLALRGLPTLPLHLLPRLPLDQRHHAKIDYAALRALLARSASRRACSAGSIRS